MKRIIYAAVAAGIVCLSLASCSSTVNINETDDGAADVNATEHNGIDWDAIDWQNDPTIGKLQAGCYKRSGITKDGETYEEMLKLRDVENKGYLYVYEDGTAIFDLDGEKTAYTYDKNNLYYSEDRERANGIPYVFIGGRLVVDDGTTITQYLKLSDEELNSLSENSGK